MRYVGLDVHKRIVQAHFCDAQGHKLRTMRFDLTTLSLQRFALEHLGNDCAVALEATTNTWAVVDILTPHCEHITVSNPLRTKAIALSKNKSDRVDAEALAQLLRCGYLPKVWIADPCTRQQRNLAARRSALVRQGAMIKNRVHSILHQHLIQAPFDPFTQQGRQWLTQLPLAPHLRAEITTQLRMLDALATEQRELMALIEHSAYASDSVKLLMTLPGVGVATAQAIVAAIGDISRFESADKLAAYFGLVPSVHQSADHAYHGRITKQGNSNVRWLLVEVAHHAGRHPGPLGHQFTRLARKKGVPVARVAIARKLAILAWHLLTKNEPYRYALPASTEHKLAELRRSQGIRHRLGPEKGQPQLPKKSYQRVRVQRGLDEVLTTESLPITTPPPAAEVRTLGAMGLSTLQPRLQVAVRTIAPVSAAERIRKGPRRKIVPGRASARKPRPLQGGAIRR